MGRDKSAGGRPSTGGSEKDGTDSEAMTDLYRLLGVERSADQAEIKAAYRRLAKELHPDRHAGDTKVADRFKEVSAAYSILGDPDKRKKYDAGLLDEKGQERGPFGAGGFGDRAGPGGFSAGYRAYSSRADAGMDGEEAGFEDVEDLFADIFGFGPKKPGARRTKPMAKKGADQTYRLAVSFADAARGATKRVTLTNGKTLDVKIPPGVTDGQKIRLAGQGRPGLNGGKPGDALVKVSVADHPYFRRDGLDIVLDLPIRLDEALAGGKIEVPTVDGRVTLSVPPGSSSGRRLRLKGRGMGPEGSRGDQYVVLKVMVPETPDPDLVAAVRKATAARPYRVRDHLDL